MKLWRISQNANNNYDTYDSAVVAAPDEQSARRISPSAFSVWKDNSWHFLYEDGHTTPDTSSDWTMPENVKVEYIGEGNHTAGTVICASFNAR